MMLTWVTLRRGSCRFWLLGRGGANDIPKAAVCREETKDQHDVTL